MKIAHWFTGNLFIMESVTVFAVVSKQRKAFHARGKNAACVGIYCNIKSTAECLSSYPIMHSIKYDNVR